MSGPEPEPSIPAEDVDDVVGVASELAEAELRRVRVADMEEIAEELDIDPRHIEPAIETLASRRAEERASEAARSATRRAWMARVAVLFAALVAIAGVSAVWTRSALAPQWAEVERARSQVETVLERRERVESLWRDRETGLDRDAELAGAENRVGIERRRYDEHAAEYNARASALPHALLCGFVGVPCRAPLASEIVSFSR